MIVFGVLNAVKLLRISKEGEMEGMDIHEHGISAYPEYVISALAAPRECLATRSGSTRPVQPTALASRRWLEPSSHPARAQCSAVRKTR